MKSTRRQFAKQAAAATAALGISSFLKAASPGEGKKPKIVCIGAHPDDPESGCGGTLSLLSSMGHPVTIIYLTRGEAGIPGTSHKDAADIRSAEAIAASRIIGAKPVFAGQIDGDTVVNNEWVEKIKQLLLAEEPAIVFTHWPMDSHKDHQVASLLTIQCWIRMNKNFELYFFEVCTGSQTMGFKPTDYVSIEQTKEQKQKAVYCHSSQNPAGIYAAADCNHSLMEKFRGIEINTGAAEAFVKMQNGNSMIKNQD